MPHFKNLIAELQSQMAKNANDPQLCSIYTQIDNQGWMLRCFVNKQHPQAQPKESTPAYYAISLAERDIIRGNNFVYKKVYRIDPNTGMPEMCKRGKNGQAIFHGLQEDVPKLFCIKMLDARLASEAKNEIQSLDAQGQFVDWETDPRPVYNEYADCPEGQVLLLSEFYPGETNLEPDVSLSSRMALIVQISMQMQRMLRRSAESGQSRLHKEYFPTQKRRKWAGYNSLVQN